MVAETVSAFGPPDILVNNAGIAVFGDPLQITDADWQRCMDVDLDGAWYCCRAGLPHILTRGRAPIVHIAAHLSLQLIRNTFPYPLPKPDLLAPTRSLALPHSP